MPISCLFQEFYPLIHHSLYFCFSLLPPCSLLCVHCRLSGHLEVCVRCSACITVLVEEVGKMKGHFCFWLSGRMTKRQQAQLKMSLHINASCWCQSRNMANFLYAVALHVWFAYCSHPNVHMTSLVKVLEFVPFLRLLRKVVVFKCDWDGMIFFRIYIVG